MGVALLLMIDISPVETSDVDRLYYVYMLASRRNGTLYIGVTNNLVRRVAEHKAHLVKGFTHDYGVTNLVWFEMHAVIDEAILREKRLKTWQRAWKIRLIEETNPDWVDLYPTLAVQNPFG